MNKPTSLLVVADSHNAKIFEKIGAKVFDLNLICEMEAELDSGHEKLGRSFNSTGSIRHAIEPHTDRRQVEKHDFAKRISDKLLEIEKEKHCDSLILIASHKVLEEIEETLNDQLKKKVTNKLAKNLIEFTHNELKEYIENSLALAEHFFA